MSEGGVRTRTRAEVSRRGSSASARTRAPARDAVAFSRALALRLVFDTGAVAVLDGYRRRVKAVSRALRRRGHRRLGALVRDENVARVAAVTCLAAAATALYVSRNKQRWAREREMRSRRAALRSQLAAARCYDEFIVVAHRMERLEERFATDPDSFFDDTDGPRGTVRSTERVPFTTETKTKQARRVRTSALAEEASRRSSRDAETDDDSDSDSETRISDSFARRMRKRFFLSTRFFPSSVPRFFGSVPECSRRTSSRVTHEEEDASNEGESFEPHDAVQDERRVASSRRASNSISREKEKEKEKARTTDWYAPYDKALIEEQLRLLRARRASGDVEEMMFGLRADILRNIGNLADIGRRLHEPLWGVPKCVREYIDETREQLRLIAREHDVPVTEKLAFLQETRHCFGRTALLLSGGGTLGTFHVGVARALSSRGCLPRVLVGSSVGSIVAAIVSSRTPDELEEFFSEEHFWDLLPDMTFFSGRDFFTSVAHLMRTGALHDIDFFQRCLRALLGDLTFQEAYDRSGGRILCVCVCATRAGEKPRLLTYLTSPHVVVWSAVAASCAFPSLFPPQPLIAKSRDGAFVPWQPEGKLGPRRWRDGSLENDLPMKELSELFNVNYFLVSQTNPHIVPILRVKKWFASLGPFCAVAAQFLESEWRHRCRQVLDLAPGLDALDFAKLFGQEWEGNVTVVMQFGWRHMRKIASNPTREFLYETAAMGERELWPKLATIESNCGIEMELDACVKTLRERLAHSAHHGAHRLGVHGSNPDWIGASLRLRGRVPSWNTVNFCGRDSYQHMAASAGGSRESFAEGTRSREASGFFSVEKPHAGASPPHDRASSGLGSRASSAGSLSEFVAVVAAEETKLHMSGSAKAASPKAETIRETIRDASCDTFASRDAGGSDEAPSPGKAPEKLRNLSSPNFLGTSTGYGASPRRAQNGPSGVSLGSPPSRSHPPSPTKIGALGEKEDRWPAHQPMPTALMRIGRVRLGASAELAPQVFGKAKDAAKDGGNADGGRGAEQQIA
jgi:TAG lipase/steryl ester hydrolase/phospholipase A2/LPA acyltransferase